MMRPLEQVPDLNLIAQLVGYGIGAILSFFLLWLAARSSEKGRIPRIVFAGCALVWNLGSLIGYGVLIGGAGGSVFQLTETLKFATAGVWPASAVAVWLDNDALAFSRHRLGNKLFCLSIGTAILIFATQVGSLLVLPRLQPDAFLKNLLESSFVNEAASYNGFVVVTAGVWLLLRGQLQGWFQRLSVAAILGGLGLSVVSMILHNYFSIPSSLDAWAVVLKHQGITLALMGSLFYFARFRALDVFVKLSLRVLIGAAFALSVSYFTLGPFQRITNNSVAPRAFFVVGITAFIGLAISLVQYFSRTIDSFVESRIFDKPDYRQAASQLREILGLLEGVQPIFAATEQFVGRTLEVEDLRVRPADERSAALAGQDWKRIGRSCAHAGADLIIPIIVGNQTRYLLMLATQKARHLVVTADLAFLREAALIVGWRLEALEREQDRVERVSREAQLVHQVVSAELRALRAQVNPHFLFNALNTIAALIPPEPEKAELMTVQLAKVFRHVLTHSDKSFSSLREEIEFLSTYLEIEKVRFGQRLRIEFDISETAAGATVPSLILQPLVENALKHGLAPKLGDNELVIRAARTGDSLSLSVEDNGVGIRERRNLTPDNSTGIGLRNVRERLRTIYGQRASLVVENISGGGSRALVMIPVRETS